MIRVVQTRDWRGAGFTRGPAVPRGLRAVRGGHLHIYAVRCGCGPMILIAGRVRAPALSVTAGLCGHVLHICGPMRSQCFYISFNVVIEKMFPLIKEP